MSWRNETKFESILGKTITALDGLNKGGEQVVITCSDGSSYRMSHDQDCCESVQVEDVCGDVADIIGAPLIQAEEASSEDRPADLPPPDYGPESQTWTFYKLGTEKGSITIRWLGTSNGYYSESVSFQEITKEATAE